MQRHWRVVIGAVLVLLLWGPSPTRAAAPAVAFQPGEADFGEWPAGSEQRPLLAITITNTGDAPLHLDHFAVPTGFELWLPPDRPCQGFAGPGAPPLPAGAACALGVAFVPAIGDAYSGSLLVYSDAPGSPHALPLHGVGLPSDQAPAQRRCFAATGYCVGVRFLAYWETHGGLAINGYPVSDALLERLEDGKIYTVQYFERVRLEYHPEHPPATEVLLGQLGRRVLTGVPGAPTGMVPALAGYTYFAETGHNVGPRFGAYWQANGGLAQFGYPLTELFEEQLEDGQTYQVQYFERARFELHPASAGTPYEVQLGQFGRRVLAQSTPH